MSSFHIIGDLFHTIFSIFLDFRVTFLFKMHIHA